MFWIWTLATFTCLIVFWVILRFFRTPYLNTQDGSSISTMVVLGSGGHTMEMIKLIENLNWNSYKPIHFVISSGDNMSMNKIPKDVRMDCKVHRIRRSREVGQSFLTSTFSFGIATLDSLKVVWTCRPKLLICNGPGTCLPTCLCVKLISDCAIIYVESFCRVDSLSLTGMILYKLADQFIVQWPQLQSKYPRSKYLGILV